MLVSDDEPVSKWELADWLAEQCGQPSPPTGSKADRLDDSSLSTKAKRRSRTEKRCHNGKLRSLGYEFRYPPYCAAVEKRAGSTE